MLSWQRVSSCGNHLLGQVGGAGALVAAALLGPRLGRCQKLFFACVFCPF